MSRQIVVNRGNSYESKLNKNNTINRIRDMKNILIKDAQEI